MSDRLDPQVSDRPPFGQRTSGPARVSTWSTGDPGDAWMGGQLSPEALNRALHRDEEGRGIPDGTEADRRPNRRSFAEAWSQLPLIEGPRGRSNRVAVLMKYSSYMLAIVLSAGATHALWAFDPTMQRAALLMMVAVSISLVAGVFGTWRYAGRRSEIVDETRRAVFGIAVFPGVGISAVARLFQYFGFDARGGGLDANIVWALPWIYAITEITAIIIMVKLMASMRNLHRSTADDEEAMARLMRQDGWTA